MDLVRVTFEPEGTSVEVNRGATLLEAAQRAGLFVSSICGGDGICGKCRVVVESGEIDADPTTLLTRDEIRRGYTLACRTRLLGDVTASIPKEARSDGAQILIDEDASRFRALYSTSDESISFERSPVVQKLYLELPAPTLQDNLACQERLLREIRRHVDAPVLQMGLKVLRDLPAAHAEGEWRMTATLGRRGGTTEVIQAESGDRQRDAYGIAVDIGTSTIVAHLVDLGTSESVDAEACYNSQMAYGEEVTRRIIHAERQDAKVLHDAVVRDINNLISALISRAEVELHDVVVLFAAGNTPMIHFLLGLDASRIRKSPYIPTTTAPPPVRAAEVGIKINSRGLLFTMPSIGSWVGGDVTAGILATGLYATDRLTMLIDVGTNGEIVLGNDQWMIACATSAGPAFEGSGVVCGMRASRGAIERVSIAGNEVEIRTIGDEAPRGICGSGLIDAVAGLFGAGILDRSGRLLPDQSARVREVDGRPEFVLVSESEAGADKDIVITQPDIENLLRAKAAIFAGAKALLESTDHTFEDIEHLLIAGGFGNYLDREKAIAIGMIPDVPLDRVRFAGNTSLVGAKMAMLSTEAFDRCETIARSATYYDLITYPDYYEEFMSAKFLPHTDLSLFPRVTRPAVKAGRPTTGVGSSADAAGAGHTATGEERA
ncbi:MAG: ASKHA domain-containing protein [Candidatus Bipolaricaulia bacterium]